jgi:hypothetical protein
MTCKRGDYGYRETPICGTAQWPVGSSGKTDTRISQHSTEQGISVESKIKYRPFFESKVKAYEGDFLVQPKHQSHSESRNLNEAPRLNERSDPIIKTDDV